MKTSPRHTRRARTAFVASTIVLGGSALTGLASAQPGYAAPQVRLSTFTPEQLADVAHSILDAGSSAASAPTFGGVAIDPSSGIVSAYVVGTPPAAVAAAVQASPEASAVRYVSVKYAYNTLYSAAATLDQDVAAFKKQGIDITMTGVDPRTNSIVVGILPASASAEPTVAAATTYPVTFTTDVGYLEPLSATRLNDTAPYNAGDFFVTYDPNGGGPGIGTTQGCTTGPIVTDPSTGYVYTLSVAHCFDNLTNVAGYNNDLENDNPNHCGFGASCGYLGTSQSHIYAPTGWDDALMSGATSFSDLEWQNNLPYNPPTSFNGYSNPQQSFSHSVLGENVCTEGAYDGQVCNSVVDYANVTAHFSNGSIRYHAYRATASVINGGHGDSGGAVVSLPGHVNVEGVIDAGNGPDFIDCILYPDRNYTYLNGMWYHTPACVKDTWYIDFIDQANIWGVVLLTG